jgi:hypothetical protein
MDTLLMLMLIPLGEYVCSLWRLLLSEDCKIPAKFLAWNNFVRQIVDRVGFVIDA